jgi:hypothetical protein
MFVVALWIFVMRHWRGQFVGETYPAFGEISSKKRSKSAKSKKSARSKTAKSSKSS